MHIALRLDPTPAEVDGILLKLVRSNWQVAQTQQGFQPLGFFTALGFDLVGSIEGNPVGSRRNFLSRRLDR